MQIQNLFQPFEVEFFRVDGCPCKAHKHTFFELVYILDGEGTYHIDNNQYKYSKDDLFLIVPNDGHHTVVKSTTSFLFIRFNNIFFNAQKTRQEHGTLGAWIRKLEFIFSNPLRSTDIFKQKDKPLIRAVCEAIVQEYLDNQGRDNELLQQLINTLLTVVSKNITIHISRKENSGDPASLNIIHYIHQNIYNPEKLKAESIASHFNISANYISEYFKKHTDENLQQYIINYKLALVEIRLKHSDMRMNEIASEFGFTDESHLSKTFRKYKKVSPSVFRKNILKAESARN
jgi:AraC-like DNA-binding protein